MTPRERTLLRAGAAHLQVALLPEAVERIGRFLGLLAEWNRSTHLTGERDMPTLIAKHVVDALALVPELPAVGPVVDIGSGAGFPGIVIGCVRPDLDLVLIESRRRPATFLREVIRSAPLPHARALDARAEDAGRDPSLAGRARLVTSRALRLDVFLELAAPFLAPDGRAVAMQTPRTAARARPAFGLRPAGSRDYTLPGGERRTLVDFGRAEF